MSDVQFSVSGIEVMPYAATPSLVAHLRVEDATGDAVHAIALRCQVRIEPQRRRYEDAEAGRLVDLFGLRARWSDTVKPFLWMHATAMVQSFSGSCDVDLPLPCTYDFDVTAVKYLAALRDGTVPLTFLFSGTVFARGANGFAVRQVPWDADAAYRMPVHVWRGLIETYFPNSGWVRVHRDTLEALARFRSVRGLVTWDATFDALLSGAGGSLGEPPAGGPSSGGAPAGGPSSGDVPTGGPPVREEGAAPGQVQGDGGAWAGRAADVVPVGQAVGEGIR